MVTKKANKVKDENVLSDIEKAAQLLEKNAQEKREACWKEVSEVLNKHGFELGIVNQFTLNFKK